MAMHNKRDSNKSFNIHTNPFRVSFLETVNYQQFNQNRDFFNKTNQDLGTTRRT